MSTSIPERLVETTVGPPGGFGTVFRDEDQEFKVKGYSSSKPNECEVTIYGLSPPMVAFLEQPNMLLQLAAGEGIAGLIFRGSIQPRGVTTKWDMPERTTTIKAVDGRHLYRDQTVAVSWPPNTPVSVVVVDMLKAATVQGYAIAPGNVYPEGIFPAGFYSVGRWRDTLTEVLFPRGYGWTIQDRTVYVGLNDMPLPGNVPLITPQTGLVGSPVRTKAGCDFETRLDSRIRPGWAVVIKSRDTNGTFRVNTREHEGSRDGTKWGTKVQCSKIKGLS